MLLPYTHVDDLEKHLIQRDYAPEQFVNYQPRNERTYSYSTVKTKSAKRRKYDKEEGMEETEEQVEASEPSYKLKEEEHVCDDSTCKLYIATFTRELLIHKNTKLIEMSQDYVQWIYLLISLRNAGATF